MTHEQFSDDLDLETLKKVSRASKKIDFAAIMAEARAEYDAREAARAARSEEEVRQSICDYVAGLVKANIRENDEVFKKLVGTVREIFLQGENFSRVSLDGTEFEDCMYLVSHEDGCVYQMDGQMNITPVTDPFIMEKVGIVMEQYEAGREGWHERRNILAASIAKGNEMLFDVLNQHIVFTGGRVQPPCTREGIDFYQVGRNASHEFYLGTKDGKLFRLSMGEDSYDTYKPEHPSYTDRHQLIESGIISGDDLHDEERIKTLVAVYNTYPVYGEQITEVKADDPGYTGHY